MQLALTPYLYSKLGRAEFGLWMLAMTLISMSQLVSCGASFAATKHVSADLASGARQHAVTAVRAALTIALVGGSVASLVSWFAAPLLAATWLRNMGDPGAVGAVIALCGPAAAMQEADSVFAGALRGAERFDLCARVEISTRIATGCVLAYLAGHSTSVATLMTGFLVMLALRAGLKAAQVELLLRRSRCYVPTLDRVALRRIAGFGSWQWLQYSGTAVCTAADQLLVGGLLGPAALARYGVCVQVAQFVHQVPAVLMQVIFPRISALGPLMEAQRGNEILRSTTIASVAIAVLIGVPVAFLAHPILAHWIGKSFADENTTLLVVLVLAHIALAYSIAPYYVLLGSGRVARSAWITSAAGAVQIIFAFIAVPFGLVAVACSRFSYALATAFLYLAARYGRNE